MSREWLAVYTAMATKPKYRRLSPIGRGALLHTFILGGFQSPEATWRDPDELREALELDGFPRGAFDELVALGWLEYDGDDLTIHDWDDHQRAASEKAQKAWEAKRKREWRLKRGSSPSPPAPPTPKEENDIPHNKGPEMSGTVRDTSGTPGLDQVVVEYESLFGPASPAKVLYLKSIYSKWPSVDRIVAGLRAERARGATRKDICGRLEKGLTAGDERADKETLGVIEGTVAA